MQISRVLSFACAASLVFVAACADESDDDGSSNNNSVNNTLADAGNHDAGNDDATGDDATGQLPDDFEYESEYYLRFTQLQFDDGTPGAGLNTLLQGNIDDQQKKYPVIVLMHLKDIDPAANTVSVRGGAGVKDVLACDPQLDGHCEYKWDPEAEDTYSTGSMLDTANGHMSAHLDALGFVATFEVNGDVNKTTIPVSDLTLEGDVLPDTTTDADGDVAIEGARLDGYVTEEAAADSQIQLTPGSPGIELAQLLGEDAKNADLDNDGTDDAWHMTASFTARQTVVVQ